MKVKIYGAGSIGIHLSQAARRMGWDVVIVDPSPEALERLPGIYTTRYGAWDDHIVLASPATEPKGGFDLICVGTPPDVRLKVAMAALAERPRVLQLEKVICPPTLEGLDAFIAACDAQKETMVVVGYDHAVAESVEMALGVLRSGAIGSVETIDVGFREHWKGIFAAHPWLRGPEDTYLGYWRRGGGAGGEHSHALHLFLLFARVAQLGSVVKEDVALDLRRVGAAEYDAVFALTDTFSTGRIGRVVQDVITSPTQKRIYVQGQQGFIELLISGSPEGDVLRVGKVVTGSEKIEEKVITKKRPDDFYREMLHINDLLESRVSFTDSPMAIGSGVDVVRILARAYGIVAAV